MSNIYLLFGMMQCFFSCLVYVKSRDKFCDNRPETLGKSSEVRTLNFYF